jgi:protein-S-isoprenylcysteine O-methyltransferase Ste14/membrane protease YdiL (CAAX protease family)
VGNNVTALDWVEKGIGWAGGLAAGLTLAVIFLGIWRGTQRATGKSIGRLPGWLSRPAFYVAASLVYFSLCWLLWRPLPLLLSPQTRIFCLVTGALTFFIGLAWVLWGRLTLGRQYFVSTPLGAGLFEQHRLVRHGPYALVRHPMYIGILLTGVGGILLYRTWTLVFVASHFFGLIVRAHREEQALAGEFGEEWQAYYQQVPRFFPNLRQMVSRLPPGPSALLELGLFFTPALPAYLWIWPNVSGTGEWIMQSLVYVYAIVGSLFIGLRRWSLPELGLNGKGLRISLIAGMAIVVGRALVILSVDWEAPLPDYNPLRLLAEAFFYFGLVGLGEELLFRGLLYKAFDEWRGSSWAIWGSSLGFALWHVFGQGLLVGAATLFYGLTFALIRWKAGGMIGLIFIHGMIDFSALLLLPDIQVTTLARPEIPHPAWLALGLALIAFTPLYLWKIHPWMNRHVFFRHGT